MWIEHTLGGFADRSVPISPLDLMVPVEGLEPPTFGLQNRCTTAVLNRHYLNTTPLYWCRAPGSNRRPHDYESRALPTELARQALQLSLAGVERLELPAFGFGDRCSTN